MTCPCGSGVAFETCCGPILSGARPAPSAEALMRSRYSAYARKDVAYLIDSHDPETRDVIDEQGVRKWAARSEWLELQILATDAGSETDERGQVEFVARFRDDRGVEHRHHERSQFVRRDGRWYFHDGEVQRDLPATRSAPKLGRNDPCSCGSGKKYKKCCGAPAPGGKA